MPEWFYHLGPMGWPLAVCSTAAFAICLERTVFLVKSLSRKHETVLRLSARLNENRTFPKPVRDDIAGIMLDELQAPYFRGISGLGLIGYLTPMLGLAGTILGIIKTFGSIASHTGPVSPNIIADGLWEAMLTTAAGILIALPSLLMATIFRHLSGRQIEEFRLCLNKLSVSFETDGTAEAENPAAAPAETAK